MMLVAAPLAGIEVRRAGDGAATLTGVFPYNVETELAPGRREVFAAGSLAWTDDVHLLSQHEFARPLASRAARTLDLRSESDGLHIEARLTARVMETTAARDALALIEEGLATGLSPGFRVLEDGETITRGAQGVLRTIRRADLLEISIVTRAAYPSAQVEARSWVGLSSGETTPAGLQGALARWRA